MSTLLTKIMLTIFMLPSALLVYIVAGMMGEYASRKLFGYAYRNEAPFLMGGLATWSFIAFYWLLLWRKVVRWTPQRRSRTFWATVASIVAGIVFGFVMNAVDNGAGYFFGSAVPPLAWLIATTLLWRETADERAERAANAGGVACPNCGYNLTGLRGARCPECGQEFTLDALLAAQQAATPADLA